MMMVLQHLRREENMQVFHSTRVEGVELKQVSLASDLESYRKQVNGPV